MTVTAVAMIIFVVVLAAIYYVGLGIVRASEAAGGRLTSMRPRVAELDKSFSERALAPIFSGLGAMVVRRSPVGWAVRTRQRLALAGWADKIDVNAWAAIRVLSLGVGSIGGFFLPGDLSATTRLAVIVGSIAAGVLLPEAVLTRKIDDRTELMRKQLPEILDLLVISVEAGLSFDAALARVVATVEGEMSAEFNRMLSETRVGVSRRDAMNHLAERTELDELQSFLLAMTQADAFGVSVVRILRVQAEEMRTKRRQRAQEKAFAAPVKMVFPLVLCIFPALMVIMLGPALIGISDAILKR
ncbi:MAG: type II secretion system F family protein [Acidimicrobiia bacterium]|nr:type II secretion system F family protein [Acidimicrobiia bacterium]MDH3470951.1 type II secretion system F family protein [Acidimicrobiia bacterium]